jgi:hypothetical protein
MIMCLPVKDPPITSFPEIANSLSILWVNKEKILPWISDHYIQLMIRPQHPLTRSNFYDQADTDNYIIPGNSCPFLGWLRINQTTAHFNDFTEYIEHQINHGYYIEACLDNFYLSCSKKFNKMHFIHTTFIYGYDNEKKLIFISDFYDNGKYTRKTVSYDEVNKSIENVDYFIKLYKYEDFDYKMNLDLMKLFMEDYVNCRDSLRKFEFSSVSYNKDILYGLKFYDYIIEVFCNEDDIDVRPFHVLYDHKIMMSIRIDYLKEISALKVGNIGQIISNNNSLIDESLNLRNMVIKYNITHNRDLLDNIKKKCIYLKKSDNDLFIDLLTYIN